MRKFDNTDFDSYNYEYIEFWMMDPFIENPNHEGGKLYFNLGDISEDILRDGRKFFENGLPGDGSDTDVEYTAWGRVPTQQQIINAFESSDENARPNQDVGFDGLRDDQNISLPKRLFKFVGTRVWYGFSSVSTSSTRPFV